MQAIYAWQLLWTFGNVGLQNFFAEQIYCYKSYEYIIKEILIKVCLKHKCLDLVYGILL